MGFPTGGNFQTNSLDKPASRNQKPETRDKKPDCLGLESKIRNNRRFYTHSRPAYLVSDVLYLVSDLADSVRFRSRQYSLDGRRLRLKHTNVVCVCLALGFLLGVFCFPENLNSVGVFEE